MSQDTARESSDRADRRWMVKAAGVSAIAAVVVGSLLRTAMLMHELPDPVLFEVDVSAVVIAAITIYGFLYLASDDVLQYLEE